MKLITQQLKNSIPKLYSQEHLDIKDQKIYVKFFTPDSNWTWYVTEGQEEEDGDWRFFGVVEGFETEAGYFMLSELMEARGPLGLKIERDMHLKPGEKKINELVKI